MQLNLSTRELDRAKLKLRDDLIVRPLPSRDGVLYQIEDPLAVRFYRIGRAEYQLLSLLDGHTSLAEAVTISSRSLGREAFSESEATSVALWLLDSGLAQPTEGTVEAAPRSTTSLSTLFNPFWMKWPLLRPEGLLDVLLPWTRWFFSGAATVAVLALWGAAIISLVGQADAFWNDARAVFSPHNWLTLSLVWLGLKIVHELGHGLCCRAHGGRVTEMGVVFVLLAPMAYVDVTSTWGFRSRWKRLHVAAAGMQVELTIAALAALGWGEATSPAVKHLLHNIVLSASVTTLLFNLNPLMRFDGYFILEDLLDVPNLGTTATRWSHSRMARLFYGEIRPAPIPTGFTGVVIRLYAVLSSVWRVLVTGSLLTGAAVMFHGAGLVLAVVAIALWYVKPSVELLLNVGKRWQRDRWSATRAVIVGGLLLGTTGATVFWLPSPFQRQAPAIVDYADLAIVRVDAPGFVDAIHVVNGQTVEAGTVLVVLRNEDLQSRVTDLELAIQQSEARRIGLVNRRELAAAQIELRNQQAQREQLAEARAKADTLLIKAPVTGRVLARRLENEIGHYLKPGTELLVIGDEAHKEIIASVDQRDLEAFSEAQEASARIQIRGVEAASEGAFAVEPRASTRLPHPALAATQGGLVDVVAEERDADSPGVRLSEPRFLLRSGLDRSMAQQTYAGQLAKITPQTTPQTIAMQLTRSFRDWARGMLDPQ